MNRHLRHFFTLGVCLALAASVADAQDVKKKDKGEKPATTAGNYYPLDVGNRWTFRVEAGGNAATAISTITKIEKVDGKALSKLEATLNGKVVATEHLVATPEGIYRNRNNDMAIDPPLLLLKYPAKAGDEWKGVLNVGTEKGNYVCKTAEEMVTVPAGKFKTLRVSITLEVAGQTVKTSYWFAKDTGFVKQTVDAGGLNVLMELEKFERAKATTPKKEKTKDSPVK